MYHIFMVWTDWFEVSTYQLIYILGMLPQNRVALMFLLLHSLKKAWSDQTCLMWDPDPHLPEIKVKLCKRYLFHTYTVCSIHSTSPKTWCRSPVFIIALRQFVNVNVTVIALILSEPKSCHARLLKFQLILLNILFPRIMQKFRFLVPPSSTKAG